jgi:hypothetical protein
MVNSEELIGTTEYLTLYARCRVNRCRYNRVQLYNGQCKFLEQYAVGMRRLDSSCIFLSVRV